MQFWSSNVLDATKIALGVEESGPVRYTPPLQFQKIQPIRYVPRDRSDESG